MLFCHCNLQLCHQFSQVQQLTLSCHFTSVMGAHEMDVVPGYKKSISVHEVICVLSSCSKYIRPVNNLWSIEPSDNLKKWNKCRNKTAPRIAIWRVAAKTCNALSKLILNYQVIEALRAWMFKWDVPLTTGHLQFYSWKLQVLAGTPWIWSSLCCLIRHLCGFMCLFLC